MNNTLMLMVLNLVGKLFSFFREMIFSFFYGTSAITDAFNTSTTAATLIFSIITYALSKTYIPTYSQIVKEKGEQGGDVFTNKLLNSSLFLSTIVMILGLVFAPYIVKLFAVGYDGAKLNLASLFMRAVILTIYPNIYAAILSAYFQVKGDFITPALPLIILNIILGATVALSRGNIYIMAIGIFLAYLVQFIVFPLRIKKVGFKRTRLSFEIDDDIKNIVKLSIPTVFSMAAVYISTIVDQSFASIVASEGGVSVVNYALKILRIVSSTFIVPFQITAYPLVGKLAANKDIKGLKDVTAKTLVKIMILFIPSIVGLMVLSRPVISFVYMRGAFGYDDMVATADVLFYYSIYLIGPAVVDVLYLSFFSMKNTKVPTIISFIQLFINIVLDYILAMRFGLIGLALATTISQFCSLFIASLMYKKYFGRLNLAYIGKNLGKIGLGSIALGLIAYKFYYLNPSNLWLLLTIAIAGLSYLIIIKVLKVDGLDEIFKNLKK